MRASLFVAFVVLASGAGSASAESVPSIYSTRVNISSGSAKGVANPRLFVSLRTPFGMERFRFELPQTPAPMPYGSHYVGTSSVRANTDYTHRATMSQFDSSTRIFFVSRRTGTPMSATLRYRRGDDAFTAPALHFSRVRRVAALPCGLNPQSTSRAEPPRAPGLGIFRPSGPNSASVFDAQAPLPFLPVREIDLAAFYDTSMQRAYDRASPDYIISTIHASNSLHLSQLGLRIQLMSVTPFELKIPEGETIEAEILLRIFRARVFKRKPRADLYHLFTGAALTGRTVGLAYVAGACVDKSSFAVGLSAVVGTDLQPIVLSHELGHGLGATHDEVLPTVMSPFLGPENNTFSAKSIDAIGRFVSQDAKCIAAPKEDGLALALDISQQIFSAALTVGPAAQGSCRVSLQTADLSKQARRGQRSRKPKWRNVTSLAVEADKRQEPLLVTLATTAPLVSTSRKQSYYFRGVARCPTGRFVSSTQSIVPPSIASIQEGDPGLKDWISALIANFRQGRT